MSIWVGQVKVCQGWIENNVKNTLHEFIYYNIVKKGLLLSGRANTIVFL